MKLFGKLSVFVCALLLMIALALPVFASNVSYDETAQKLVLETESGENPTDLFENFKYAMPGDVLTQEIFVTNLETNKKKVVFYLKSTGATEQSVDLLSKMTLKVEAEDGSSFEAPADQPATLEDWVMLGTLSPAQQTKLTLTLSIPIELGNDYQDAVGIINWQFKAEEVPVHKTGDNTNSTLWIILAAVAVVGLAVCVVFATRKKEK